MGSFTGHAAPHNSVHRQARYPSPPEKQQAEHAYLPRHQMNLNFRLPASHMRFSSAVFPLSTLLILYITPISASTHGYFPVSLCPSNSTAAKYVSRKLINPQSLDLKEVERSNAVIWEGKQLAPQEVCPVPLVPSSQDFFVDSLELAERNVPNTPATSPPSKQNSSKLYAFTVFRSASVKSAYLDVAISDAAGQILVPRMKITLKHNDASSRRTASKITMAHPKKGKSHAHTRHARGRRKGKGGGFGGGRSGGGSGGFRSSAPGSSSRTYGYSTSALSSRYAPGYSRTGYGYSGRSMLYVGAPMFLLYSHGGYRGWASCSRYHGAVQSRCQDKYAACRNSTGSSCISKASSILMRDDIMAATVNSTKAVFPLKVTIYRAVVAFSEQAQPEPWEDALMFSFSEVDFDDEYVWLPIWAFVLILISSILFGFSLVCICCFCSRVCCKCRRSTNSNDCEQFDIEAAKPSRGRSISCPSTIGYPKPAWSVPVVGTPVMQCPAVGTPVSIAAKDQSQSQSQSQKITWFEK